MGVDCQSLNGRQITASLGNTLSPAGSPFLLAFLPWLLTHSSRITSRLGDVLRRRFRTDVDARAASSMTDHRRGGFNLSHPHSAWSK
jgi:hypothetical protein